MRFTLLLVLVLCALAPAASAQRRRCAPISPA